MTNAEYAANLGWNAEAMSCSCPQGFKPCTTQQVEQDRTYWTKDVSPWGQQPRLSATSYLARQNSSCLLSGKGASYWEQGFEWFLLTVN